VPSDVEPYRDAAAGAAMQKSRRDAVGPQQAGATVDRMPLGDATQIKLHCGVVEVQRPLPVIKHERVTIPPCDVEGSA